MSDNNTDNNSDSLKSWLIILGFIFGILFFAIILLFSFSDFAFLNHNNADLTMDSRINYGIKALTTIGATFGGLALLTNAYYASRTAKAANETAKAANENAQAAQDKQITERFSKAIELLGNQQLEVKLGGIYALEQIAKDAPEKYHWTIMEVLTAFVRENAPLEVKDEVHKKKKKKELPKLRTAIQAALTVIGRRENKHLENQSLDLSNIDIRGANLDGIELEGVNLDGSNLEGVKFYCANLKRADLHRVNLQNAFLCEARMQGAVLIGADLRDTILQKAKLQGTIFNGSDLQGTELYGANLQAAQLYRAKLQKVDLRGAENLTSEQIEEAIGDEDTKLPDYIDRPKHWTKSE